MLAIINGLLWSFLRRWFGGLLEQVPGLRSRGLQTAVMIGAMLLWFISPNCSWGCWLAALLVVAWLQFIEISTGHGPVFDVGRDDEPSEETVNRYRKMWGFRLLVRVFPESARYGFLFDFLLLFIRYTLPMLPLALLSWGYVIIGMAAAPVYAFCWTLFERDSLLVSNLPAGLNNPTRLSEAVWGFIFGFGLAVING